MEKVLGKRKLNNKDVANIEALDRDWFETAQVKARVIKESLPTELREKLKEAVFVGERVYGLDAEKDLREEITAKGFDEALKTANAHYSWEYSNCYWSNVLLKYSDENTEATVEGFSTGDYPSPDVNIKHNGQEYSWREFMPAY